MWDLKIQANVTSILYPELLELRQKVGTLDAQRWRQAVSATDPATVLKRSYSSVNRAFFKGVELIEWLDHVPETVVCLCEAPGGFYEACTRLLPSCRVYAHSYMSESSIQYHDCVRKEDRLVDLPYHGDITHPEVVSRLESAFQDRDVTFVFADGGKQPKSLDHSEQESLKLLCGQIVTAISILKPGGMCIAKCFEGNTVPTRQLIHVASLAFSKVNIIKPHSSRMGNSERYIIFQGRLEDVSLTCEQLMLLLSCPHDLAYASTLNETLQVDSRIEASLDKFIVDQIHGLKTLVSLTRESNSGLDRLLSKSKEHAVEIEETLFKFGIRPMVQHRPATKRKKF